MDLSEVKLFEPTVIAQHVQRGMTAFGVAKPVNLVDWAEENFYLSAESSYVEQRWRAWPFQRAILACIGNDAISEVCFQKSARVGWTKMLLAAIGYFAAHKRRNQAIWQPTDSDRDEFVKAEIDPMLRDVAAMREVMPRVSDRHKDNTLQIKKFIGSLLYLRGGTAAKNYRRISVDVAMLDEIDAFDADVEKDGDPVTLAAKRSEGATFPKLLIGSTPRLRGFSLVETRARAAEARYRYQIQCPECSGWHALTWFSEDEPHGMRWTDGDPDTVRHLCPHCACLVDQGRFLRAAPSGRWVGDDGTTIDGHGVFRDADGDVITPPRRIAFFVWTAYSPAVSWPDLVREYLTAKEKSDEGDENKLKAFVNTTLGETYEGEVERTDAEDLKARAEPFALRLVPQDCLVLLAGCDTQDNRIEVGVWGFGRGSRMWTIDHRVFWGSPNEEKVWNELEEFLLETRYPHAARTELGITASAIDSGGHYTQAVYAFAHVHAGRNVFATRGRPSGEKHIKDGATQVDIDWRGRRKKKGVVLWHIGTNHAKDLIHSRQGVTKPGPGYVHLSNELQDEWFRQMAGEMRVTRRSTNGSLSRWTATRKRVEALDCAVGAIWLEHHLELGRRSDAWWRALEERVQPATGDLFALAPPPAAVEPPPPVRALSRPKISLPVGSRLAG